jgi:hypothetical protein
VRILGLGFQILHLFLLEGFADGVMPTADLSSIDSLPPMPGDAPTLSPEPNETLSQAPEPPKESLPDLPTQKDPEPEFEITQTQASPPPEEQPPFVPVETSPAPLEKFQAVVAEPPSLSSSKSDAPAQLIDFESLDDEKWQISVPDNRVGEELLLHERNLHSLGGGLGYLRNWQTNPSTNQLVSGYFAAGFLRYQVFLLRAFLFKSMQLQDGLSLEGTVFLHRNIHYRVLNDSYFLVTPLASLRYQLSLGPYLAVFAYVGYLRHFVLSSVNGTQEGIRILESQIVTGGGGFIFTFGPGWYLRCDGGFDQWSAGIGIRL